jgi:hypothetical protein
MGANRSVTFAVLSTEAERVVGEVPYRDAADA